jgi:hypothetical protein
MRIFNNSNNRKELKNRFCNKNRKTETSERFFKKDFKIKIEKPDKPEYFRKNKNRKT